MKKHLILVLVVIAGATVMIAGCTSSSTPSPSPSATTTAVSSATVATDAAAALGGNASNATNLTAVQGQNFAIQLPSNSSIGNGNHWALSLYDASSVTLVNQTYVGGSLSAPGPRADVFTFQGTKTGTSVITFNCVSPTNQIENTVKYTINCTTLNVPTVNAVYISHGQDFAIRLPSNPSTGYHWELSSMTTLPLSWSTRRLRVTSAHRAQLSGGRHGCVHLPGNSGGNRWHRVQRDKPANQTTSAVVYSVVIAS